MGLKDRKFNLNLIFLDKRNIKWRLLHLRFAVISYVIQKGKMIKENTDWYGLLLLKNSVHVLEQGLCVSFISVFFTMFWCKWMYFLDIHWPVAWLFAIRWCFGMVCSKVNILSWFVNFIKTKKENLCLNVQSALSMQQQWIHMAELQKLPLMSLFKDYLRLLI